MNRSTASQLSVSGDALQSKASAFVHRRSRGGESMTHGVSHPFNMPFYMVYMYVGSK